MFRPRSIRALRSCTAGVRSWSLVSARVCSSESDGGEYIDPLLLMSDSEGWVELVGLRISPAGLAGDVQFAVDLCLPMDMRLALDLRGALGLHRHIAVSMLSLAVADVALEGALWFDGNWLAYVGGGDLGWAPWPWALLNPCAGWLP
jgi:hypothetical protein